MQVISVLWAFLGFIFQMLIKALKLDSIMKEGKKSKSWDSEYNNWINIFYNES